MPKNICWFKLSWKPREAWTGWRNRLCAGVIGGERHLWAACDFCLPTYSQLSLLLWYPIATSDKRKGHNKSEKAHKRKTFPNGLLSTESWGLIKCFWAMRRFSAFFPALTQYIPISNTDSPMRLYFFKRGGASGRIQIFTLHPSRIRLFKGGDLHGLAKPQGNWLI